MGKVNIQLREQIKALDRQPFREMLAKLIRCEPTVKSITQFANKYPDRYWQAIAVASRQAGFSEKAATNEYNFYLQVHSMPDSAIEEKILELQKKLTALPGEAVEQGE